MSLRRTRIRAISEKQLALREADGDAHPVSTFRRKPPGEAGTKRHAVIARKPARKKRARNTGPKRSVKKLVRRRSGKECEWPGCGQPATDQHHRLNRKSGGRHGEAHERVNGAAWLIDSCRLHHRYVTSPVGERRERAEQMGWLLKEHQDATRVPVLTMHDPEPVWFDNFGKWHRFEDGAA